MIEFILIVGLIILAHRLRRAARDPSPRLPVEIHVYHHHFFPDGPGERQPDDDEVVWVPETLPSNVVRLRKS